MTKLCLEDKSAQHLAQDWMALMFLEDKHSEHLAQAFSNSQSMYRGSESRDPAPYSTMRRRHYALATQTVTRSPVLPAAAAAAIPPTLRESGVSPSGNAQTPPPTGSPRLTKDTLVPLCSMSLRWRTAVARGTAILTNSTAAERNRGGRTIIMNSPSFGPSA